MSMTEKIRIILLKQNMSAAELARRLDTSPSNLYGKLRRDNFSESELQAIARGLDCSFQGNFVMQNGEMI